MAVVIASDERPKSLFAMCLLGLAVGVIAGLGAWVFRLLIGLLHNAFFLGQWSATYDTNVHTATNPWGAGILFAPVIGGLAVVWLVKTFAPEAKGHGVPEVMDAIHYGGGQIRPIVAAVKSVASAICIGSGGSVGREGPIIQIGSAFASTLGQTARLPARQQITLIAAGAGAGIAATFNAPLGGILFAIELLLMSVNVRNLLPVALATVTAGYIGRALMGTRPAFDIASLRVTNFQLVPFWMMLLFIPFGILIGLVSVVFVKGIYWSEDRFDALPVNDYVRHSIGMSVVGVLMFAMWQTTGHYYLQGVGYATIMDVISGALTDPLFLLLLCVLKFIATSLTLGSGGSGGVFSPAVFVGATLGASIGQATNALLPGLQVDVVVFTLAGIAGVVGASTGAFLTATVMLHELTGDNNVVLPVILTTVVACGVRKVISPASIYTLKLIRRGHVVPEGLQSALDDARCVQDVMTAEFRVVANRDEATESDGIVVVEQDGKAVDVVHPFGHPTLEASRLEHLPSFIAVEQHAPLLDAMRKLQLVGAGCALVFSRADSTQTDDLVGALTLRELSLYHTEMARIL